MSVPILGSPGLLVNCSFESVLSEGEVTELEAIGDSLVCLTGYVTSGMVGFGFPAYGFVLQLCPRRESSTSEHLP